MSLIELKKYNFGKLTYKALGPSYNLSELKDKTLIYLSKNP